MQIFSQNKCNSNEILLTTVYHHKNSRIQSNEAPQFSFLMETIPSKPDNEIDEQEQTFDETINRLLNLSDNIIESMNQVDQQLKEELTKRGRMQYLKITDTPFPSVNQSLYKRSLGNPTQFSDVQREASVFQVDQNNNYLKFKEKSSSNHLKALTTSLILHQHPSKKQTSIMKPKSTTFKTSKPTRKRVYQSVLSQFSTATLLKMNSQQS